MRRQNGFTLLQLLAVIAIIGMVSALSFYNFRNYLRAEQVRGTSEAFRQMLWQASTSASARLEPVVLSYTNNTFFITGQDTATKIRTEPVPARVTNTFPTSKTLVFLPSGRISTASYDGLTQPVQLKGGTVTYSIVFTLIGQSKLTVSQ